MALPRIDPIRRFDARGEPLVATRVAAPASRLDDPDRVELPLPLWRRRVRPESNVIVLRTPSWVPGTAKP
jgi:hypothetical protein